MTVTRNGETWSRGTNSRLLFDVNVMLNLCIIVTCFCQNGKGKVRDLTKAFANTEALP